MNKACFLDRDGVIIAEKHYLNSLKQVELIPGVSEAVTTLKANGYLSVVVSNQSGVARGYFTEDRVNSIHEEIDKLLIESGAPSIDAYFYCPHHEAGSIPEYAIKCNCRKPAPGMFLEAVKQLDIDITQSFMIGDKLSDINAAQNAGCSIQVLVRTGHGKREMELYETGGIAVAESLLPAVQYCLNHGK